MQLTFPAIVIFTAKRIPKKKRVPRIPREMFTGRKAVFQIPYHFIALHSACTNQQFILVPVRTPPRDKVFLERSLRAAMIFHLCHAGLPVCLPNYQIEIIRRPRNARKARQSNLNWNKLGMFEFRDILI